MMNMREVRKLQNDVNWIKTQLEDIKRWRRKHDARGHEQDMETSAQEEVSGIEHDSKLEDAGRGKKASPDKPEDRTNKSINNSKVQQL